LQSEKKSNEWLLQKIGTESKRFPSNQRRKLTCDGHILRSVGETLHKGLLVEVTSGSRRRGRRIHDTEVRTGLMINERPIRTLFQKRCSFGSPPKKFEHCQRQKCGTITPVSGGIRPIRIFVEFPG